MKKFSQKGFTHLALLLLLAVIVIVALAGYKIAKDNSQKKQLDNGTAAVTPVQTIPAIENTADLNTAEATLNNQNVDGDLNPDSLDQDVKSLY
jgi:Tfp pilus assembly major pilin PilA